MIKVYVLCDDKKECFSVIGVYKTRQKALNAARDLELKYWFISVKELDLELELA